MQVTQVLANQQQTVAVGILHLNHIKGSRMPLSGFGFFFLFSILSPHKPVRPPEAKTTNILSVSGAHNIKIASPLHYCNTQTLDFDKNDRGNRVTLDTKTREPPGARSSRSAWATSKTHPSENKASKMAPWGNSPCHQA